jgi:hypothetical protein
VSDGLWEETVPTRARWLGAVLLALVAGCGSEAVATIPPAPAPAVATFPAAAAGGACQLLDYGVIEEVLGVRFDVAAASRHKGTQTCVVQAEGAARPDLLASVTGTTADAAVFADEVAPEGATTVKGLGKAAYRVVRAAGRGSGPGVEVGWLTGDKEKQLIMLRYTLAAGQPAAKAEALAPKLITLAKKLDTAPL